MAVGLLPGSIRHQYSKNYSLGMHFFTCGDVLLLNPAQQQICVDENAV